MAWIIIILLLIVAFGPILWLMPSARERRLASLRQRAYRQGMRVDLRRLPGHEIAAEDRVTPGGRRLDTTREVAAYVMPLESRLRRLPTWRVLRHGDGSSALSGWSFEAGRRPEHDKLSQMLEAARPALDGLPQDVVAVEVESHGVAAYWLEGPDTTPERVDDLAMRLAALGRTLRDLDARLEQEALPGNI